MATVIATATVRVAGNRQMVTKGQTYDTSDKVVKANKWLFATPDEYAGREAKPKSTDELGSRSMSSRKKAK